LVDILSFTDPAFILCKTEGETINTKILENENKNAYYDAFFASSGQNAKIIEVKKYILKCINTCFDQLAE
jgi:hypothetical protein